MADLAILGGQPLRSRPYPSWPMWDDSERENLIATLESGAWWSGDGDRAQRFADDFAAFQGASHGLPMTNGTAHDRGRAGRARRRRGRRGARPGDHVRGVGDRDHGGRRRGGDRRCRRRHALHRRGRGRGRDHAAHEGDRGRALRRLRGRSRRADRAVHAPEPAPGRGLRARPRLVVARPGRRLVGRVRLVLDAGLEADHGRRGRRAADQRPRPRERAPGSSTTAAASAASGSTTTAPPARTCA